MDPYQIQVYGELKAQLARMEAKIDSLEARSAEERDALRDSQSKFDTRMDAFDDVMRPVRYKQEGHERAISTLQADVKVISDFYSKSLGVITVMSVLGSMLLSGVIWVLTHLSEAWAFLGFMEGGSGGPPTH